MKYATNLLLLLLMSQLAMSQVGYNVGDKAKDFRLKNIDGKFYSLKDLPDHKGVIVIFSCNHCPFVVAYEDRMIELHNKYAPLGYPVVAINPNDSTIAPQDSWSAMKVRAAEKGFPFLYLIDEKQDVFPRFGATRTPHVYLLNKDKKGAYTVAYIGAIDDNYKDAAAVEEKYLEHAIKALMEGKKPDPSITKAIGCTIKVKP